MAGRNRVWFDRNPSEVVTLLLVNYQFVNVVEIKAEYLKADLAHYGYVPPNITTAPPPSSEFNKTWPTLGGMIDNGERLVTFINALVPDKENAPYLLNEYDFVWSTEYDITSASSFSCDPKTTSNTTTMAAARASGRVFILNHLLYLQQAFGIKTPDKRVIASTNSWDGPGGLGLHMKTCANEVGRQPTFVLVDFFNVGPAIKFLDIFNKIKSPEGGKHVSDQPLDGGFGARRKSESIQDAPAAGAALILALLVALILL